ncbi:MAG: heme ABC exporter ATP-binding protein CcmA [Desulfovibrio sp.]|nr:heme ABC exporter ATP-binding protein CcmA [Desulfovibrio sp.]
MIQIHNLAKQYGQRSVLKGVNANFRPGTTTLLSGNNGSGKTTLLKLIAGLAKPTSGLIEIDEHQGEPARISYVAHQTFLYPSLTAFENLAFWSKCYDLPDDGNQIYDILEEFNLLPFADTCTRSFSRGMSQRLNLARAFMLNPSILLLDEPFTGLDSPSQELLRQKLLDVREKGTCSILITHDIFHDASLADAVLRIEGGSLSDVSTETLQGSHPNLIDQFNPKSSTPCGGSV